MSYTTQQNWSPTYNANQNLYNQANNTWSNQSQQQTGANYVACGAGNSQFSQGSQATPFYKKQRTLSNGKIERYVGGLDIN